MVNMKLRPLYLKLRAPVPVVEEDGWAPTPVWMDIQKRKYFFPNQTGRGSE
jgi:hypothetical protein